MPDVDYAKAAQAKWPHAQVVGSGRYAVILCREIYGTALGRLAGRGGAKPVALLVRLLRHDVVSGSALARMWRGCEPVVLFQLQKAKFAKWLMRHRAWRL